MILAMMIGSIVCNDIDAQSSNNERETLVLESKAAKVVIDLAGGSIIDFRINGSEMNPLTWHYSDEMDTEPRRMGHFICFDRWGPPSDQEKQNGMPFHGEASTEVWNVLQPPGISGSNVNAIMNCVLPMAGMTLKRSIMLSNYAPVFIVNEEITNNNQLGRVWNIVQHVTIAPPFLDETVVVDTNVDQGFVQADALPNPEASIVNWPDFSYQNNIVDMRRLTNNANPDVVSYVLAENTEYGWITAANPGKGLLIGYLWDREEYPWINLWRNVSQGKPSARGLEFGTTGLHQSYPVIMQQRTIFNTPIYSYIDSMEKVQKSYIAFLAMIPEDFKGVDTINWQDGHIELIEKAALQRHIIIDYR